MKVLVDGAAGFLGRHVVEALLRRGLAVRATDRAPLPGWEGVERVERDLATGPLRELFEGVTHVVHVAGLFDLSAPPAALLAVNEGLTRRVARAAALAGVTRFVHVSSVTVYGRPRGAPVREDAPVRPGSAYERSKAAGERALAEVLGLPAVVLRPSGIYGPHGRYGLAAAIASLALARSRGGKGHRSLRGGPRMTHVHVEDVAEAAAHLVAAPGVVGRAFNVADGHAVRWGELMAALERELGLEETRPLSLSPWKARAAGHAARLMRARTERTNAKLARAWARLCEQRGLEPALLPRLDASAYDYWSADHVYAIDALRETGWSPRYPDAIEGLRQTLAWYRARRWIP